MDPSLKEIGAMAAAAAERQAIRLALRATQGNKSAAARLLRVDYKTLHLKMKRHAIEAVEFRPLRNRRSKSSTTGTVP